MVTRWSQDEQWEVYVVIPAFRTRNVGTQLEWICACTAFGNDNRSHAEGWSKYLPDAPPARLFGDGCYQRAIFPTQAGFVTPVDL